MKACLPMLALAACGQPSSARPVESQAPITGERPYATKPFAVTEVARFDSPWAMAFLPDGWMLVTQKAGALKLVARDGRSQTIVAGTPVVDSAGQGGLMDVVLDPGFAANRTVYLSWSEMGTAGKHVALGRGKLSDDGAQLIGFATIFRAGPDVVGDGHYSGRIAFAPNGDLFFTAGERQQFTPAQDLQGGLGKVLRLTGEGKPAAGNPFYPEGPFKPAVWSYGHRNLLGIAFDASGKLWEVEMGPRGGDELNLVLPGRNYGWPIVSNGNHYDRRDIPDHPTRPEFEAPKVSWNPVISPSSLAIYSGAMFPAWRGNALIGGLSSKSLVRVVFEGTGAREAERYDMGARIRAVRSAPDGSIYLLEDEGRMIRLTPRAAAQ